MGHPAAPSVAAPAYDDLIQEHPVNAYPPLGSTSAYRILPEDEPDIELAHAHSPPANSFTPHQHCETCDTLITAREVRANERHCCLWVSIVSMTISVSLLLLGIVAVGAKYKHHKQ
ncbi:uncharacterized protein M421DRAFT_231335 [Didymella exigua CBS 183.55]|uniref:LITAF domain-containing protein n=1 Tax=Didymella exigua CBS 183.55 TaxID=1150837 RepID=A0A6A5RDN0_9PLEO|nr:uncharacterized protein M421DRAFT_231335 [Didymella exigua CBS 183.55]KAF1925782.1 hypothetical protein M421DRAFT_231335 [Didymella exigua CBS 183.55]